MPGVDAPGSGLTRPVAGPGSARGRDSFAVFYIYRYYTSIWVFLILFGVVLVCGMRKWYAKLDSCSGQPLEPHRKREARLTGFAQMAHRLALRYSSS